MFRYILLLLTMFLLLPLHGETGKWYKLDKNWRFGYPLELEPFSTDGTREHHGIVVNAPYYATKIRANIKSFTLTRKVWGNNKEYADILQVCDKNDKVIHSFHGAQNSRIECVVAGNTIKIKIFSRANLLHEKLAQDGVDIDDFSYFVPDSVQIKEIFPKNFYWGAATSAFQVEGNSIGTDWWEFADGSPDRCNGDKIGRCADHYNLYEKDFAIAKDLGLKMFRLGIEWARIEPQQGVFDQKEIEHYRKVLISLRNKGIEPMVTLHHFASPLWFAAKGGFEKRENIVYFNNFVAKIASSLGDLITYYITINEPMTYILGGWFKGIFPPGKQNPLLMLFVYANCLEAHGRAYQTIHKNDPKAMVSLAKHMRVIDANPGSDPLADQINKLLRFQADSSMNQEYLNSLLTGEMSLEIGGFGKTKRYQVKRKISSLKGSIDYFAFNYYTHDLIYFNLLEKPDQFGVCMKYRKEDHEYTVMGERWEYYPKGIHRLLMRLKKFSAKYEQISGKKLGYIISENGIGEKDKEEGMRCRFIIDHLHYLHKAIADGANVIGYLHWSLIDNFELAEGYWPRFGLVHVNYKTLKRTYKPSAYLYKKIIANNGLSNEVFKYVIK